MNVYFTRKDYRSLKRCLSGENRESPIGWRETLNNVAVSLTGENIRQTGPETLVKQALLFSFKPDLMTYLFALLRKKIIYTCWGVPKRIKGLGAIGTYLKEKKLNYILRMSSKIFVNDETTYNYVKSVNSRVKIIPYVVDRNYFKSSSDMETDDYYLVPGDNDRDENLVVEMARHGIPILRICRKDNRIYELEENRNIRNLKVKKNVSYNMLLNCYKNARAVLLPLNSINHAGGQTSLLEALSCGKRVIITETRTSQIKKSEFIKCVKSNTIDEWLNAIEELSAVKVNIIEKNRIRNLTEENGVNNVERIIFEEIKEIINV